MGKLLAVDDLEIRFEKQHPSHASKWCVCIRAKIGEKTESLMMIKTDNKPYTIFSYDNGRTVTYSKKTQKEILCNVVKNTSFEDKNINNLKHAYNCASHPEFKKMWIKKLNELKKNNDKN